MVGRYRSHLSALLDQAIPTWPEILSSTCLLLNKTYIFGLRSVQIFSGLTGVALGLEVDDKMPQHEYYEYFGPDYTLHVAPSNMENKNSRPLLEEIRANLLDNLSKLQHAPSVQFQERPPDTELPEADEDEDDGDERWDPDSEMEIDAECKPLPSRVKREIVELEPKDMEEK
ncbi:hypothetical protein HYC85_017318 [Camellia sinensis]|uniref:Histone deacetylase n=1 Tax=Camellia sinensis TaxID=4442 RepID=A0A7J7H2A1_CAMSI|nr:hypothetical protein HYC85_017318 [Camellia sinensis]